MKKDDFGTAEEKSEMGRSTNTVAGSKVIADESNGELTEDYSDNDPPSSETGRVIKSRPLPDDRK